MLRASYPTRSSLTLGRRKFLIDSDHGVRKSAPYSQQWRREQDYHRKKVGYRAALPLDKEHVFEREGRHPKGDLQPRPKSNTTEPNKALQENTATSRELIQLVFHRVDWL